MTKDMPIVVGTFLERLSESVDETDFREALTSAALGLDLLKFAYLSLPLQPSGEPRLISNYPPPWTAHYLRNQYQRVDPVILRARVADSPFRWESDLRGFEISEVQQKLFVEAAEFGICCGLTIPIVDSRGRAAAMTFAAREPSGLPRVSRPVCCALPSGMGRRSNSWQRAFTFMFAANSRPVEWWTAFC
ncbi:autoinducer binding domain-containing protein [Mesorhizobium sp.]|uniref:autoinducer binding domain-containing protein n=1 Tax=Mesorhizobium sp. TaxID=1871066 RepID=UPI0025808681|nr:autoinducer binding domain-containing protein [Mesorhizobium sp.]